MLLVYRNVTSGKDLAIITFFQEMIDSIIVDESMFEEAFILERFGCRDSQIKEIARSLSPARQGHAITNLFVHGPPGIGKTVVCKWILKEHFPRHSVYVNCWSVRTSHKILAEILVSLGYVVHGRESTSELVKKLGKLGKRLIICLDEFDYLKDKEKDILYDLLRNSCGIILISNSAYALSTVDSRVKSSLLVNEIEFRPYSREDIKSILKERISFGLRSGSMSDGLLSIIATMSGGDARMGLQTIKVAAKEAEAKGKPTLSIEEVRNAAKFARKYKLSYLLGKLNDHQKLVYEILKKNRRMDSGKLFDEYCRATKDPVVDRAYRNHMERMLELGLVRSAGSGRWKKYEIVS